MKKKDLKHIDLNRKSKLSSTWNMLNDSRYNPSFISQALKSRDRVLEIKSKDEDKTYYLYKISSFISSSTSPVHTKLFMELGMKSLFLSSAEQFNLQFIADKKYSIEDVNNLLNQKINKYGINYFSYIEPVAHKYFLDTSRRYNKLYDLYKDIETGYLFIVYKELFGNYDYRAENYTYFLGHFSDRYSFSYHASYTNDYPSEDAIEACLKVGMYCKVKEVINYKNEFYKAYKAIKKSKYYIFGASPYNTTEYEASKKEISLYNDILKNIRKIINKIKEE